MSAAVAIWSAPPAYGPGMSESVKKSLLAACRHLLHPLVRILLRQGVSFGEFADAVRGAYIDIAAWDLVPQGRPLTDTRLGILTGISARDVARIRANDTGDGGEVDASQIARVLQGWSQDREYLGPYGLPLEVPFAGDGTSFEQLVAKYTDGVSPRLLLSELVRVNAAFETDDGYVRLLNRTYLPSPLDRVGLERLGAVVGYFIDTVDYNLQKKKQGAGRFERSVITMEGLSPDDLAAFDQFVRAKGQEFLEILDDWLGEHEIEGGHKLASSESIRTGVGVFHFIDKSLGADEPVFYQVSLPQADGDTQGEVEGDLK